MWPCRHGFFVEPVFLPWFAMTDSRIADIKTAGTQILIAGQLLVIPGSWNGENWVASDGLVIEDPWKWMPMPEPV